MDDWAKIRQLFSTGQHSKREIGRLVGVSRGTVDRALEADRVPKYQRASTGSSFDAFAAQVRVLLAAMPTMLAPVLFGAHRKPVGAIVSVALLDQLESLLEDVVIAPEIHERIERGAGEASMAQIAEGLGLDPADFE